VFDPAQRPETLSVERAATVGLSRNFKRCRFGIVPERKRRQIGAMIDRSVARRSAVAWGLLTRCQFNAFPRIRRRCGALTGAGSS
jgi:hypothetical protein